MGEIMLKKFSRKKFVIQAATPKNGFVSDDTDIDWVKYRRNPQGVTTFAKYKDTSDLAMETLWMRIALKKICLKWLQIMSIKMTTLYVIPALLMNITMEMRMETLTCKKVCH